MNAGVALGNGLAQRPGSAFVELVHKSGQLGAVRARQKLFERREAELFREPRPEQPRQRRPRPDPSRCLAVRSRSTRTAPGSSRSAASPSV